MLPRLLILLACLQVALTSASIEDNMLPTDEEIVQALLRHNQGQPEVESSLGLPSDEESYNQLHALFNPLVTPSGTHHFVSSSFPEVDARGFHEAVFDGFGDYYPPWKRTKRDPLGINSRGFHEAVFDQGFGEFHPVKKANRFQQRRSEDGFKGETKNDLSSLGRRKRDVTEPSHGEKSSHAANQEDEMEYHGDSDLWDGKRNSLEEPNKRKPDMGGNGFHGDTFNHGFGDFWTMKKREALKRNASDDFLFDGYINDWPISKRRLGMGPAGFHGDTFTSGFGDFSTMKRALIDHQPRPSYGESRDMKTHGENTDYPKRPFEPLSISRMQMLLSGLEQKRRPEMGASGFHGDTFNGGFGDFWTMKKRKPEMGASGFHGDTFNGGFGDFWTMKKRKPEMGASGFHGDTFNNGFGDFWTMKKRKPEMGASGFHGDTFNNGFGDFWTMKKRKPEMGQSGFHGDTFNNGFGDFWTMKKRKPEMGQSGFHGDTFNNGFGDFWTMRKRKPEMDSFGLHGDTLNSGFGDYWSMKKRRPEMGPSGFHGDTFNGGFGDFWTMKRPYPPANSRTANSIKPICKTCVDESTNQLSRNRRSTKSQ